MREHLEGSFAHLSTLKGARGGMGDAPSEAGAPPPPSALLHRNSNNSPQGASKSLISDAQKSGYRLRKSVTILKGRLGFAEEETLRVTCNQGEGLDSHGRGWEFGEDGKTLRRVFGGITSAEAKRGFSLRQNVEAFTDHYRHEQCGFLTLTPERADMTPKEFGAIWDDMRKTGRGHAGLEWLKAYVRVLEAQKRGAPHYHLCVATPYDLNPSGFDWDVLKGSYEARKAGDLVKARALTKQYAQSATPELRAIWAELREVCTHYGLGRSEFLPFRKGAGAVAHYIGKYLEGGLSYKNAEWKGARRVEYDRKESKEWKRCASAFSWVSPGAKQWRERVGELAAAIGAQDHKDLVKILGSKWAYHVRPTIMTADCFEWRRLLGYLANEHGGKVERKPRFTLGDQVLAWWPSSEDNVQDYGSTFTIHGELKV